MALEPAGAGADPGPPETNSGGHGSLGRVAAWLAKQVEIGLATADLSLAQYRVLGLLDEHSAVSSDLAERLAVRPPSVTAIIDGLVARGLVERRNVEADRRRVDHALTDGGRTVLAEADAAVTARLSEITACLADQAEEGRAYDGLRAWRSAFITYRRTRLAERVAANGPRGAAR